MEQSNDEKPRSPTDDEIAAMLEQASGGRKKRRDDTKPSPRLPEALYYYVFMLVESAIVLGVWGFMQRGPREVLKGPSLEAPVGEQLLFHVKSVFWGLGDVLTIHWYIAPLVALLCTAVFFPRTGRGRKRMATLVSGVVVGLFLLLIAMQFSEDLARAGSYAAV
ncbi:MAG: hypothetical protein KF696_02505 [Planctomycetes bacterium]|nr:hypothetical protein [Planctomycetota bacterium]MCW8134874.1 hypothetical protein [Planctomycetota bacterium]